MVIFNSYVKLPEGSYGTEYASKWTAEIEQFTLPK